MIVTSFCRAGIKMSGRTPRQVLDPGFCGGLGEAVSATWARTGGPQGRVPVKCKRFDSRSKMFEAEGLMFSFGSSSQSGCQL